MSKKVSESVILEQIYSDVYLCVLAGAFIWFYVILHIQSLFLGSIAMLNIGISIPMGVVVYRVFC